MSIPVFPALIGQTYPLVRKPIWQTLKLSSVSGRRARYPLRNIPQYQFTLQFDLLRSRGSYTELQSILGFYNSMRGSYGVFQFNYPDDNQAVGSPFGTGDGTSSSFQLMRAYGGFTEPVYLPITATISINGSAVTNYTIGSTGLVTFSSPPANGAQLSWTGTFNWLCRFDDDEVEFSNFADQFWELQKILFTSEVI